ncbi:hypothetical protein GN958_ATG02773 [Phytophthora infestans]|uniref:Uncharacterized protein n=1 Tax=Phytophthora infestans TaxID=4787 RepID=A0A8S9VA48_PHYIN|nr:hypothetical protein GN958_ATG02773 [Phytophthora infestans]
MRLAVKALHRHAHFEQAFEEECALRNVDQRGCSVLRLPRCRKMPAQTPCFTSILFTENQQKVVKLGFRSPLLADLVKLKRQPIYV